MPKYLTENLVTHRRSHFIAEPSQSQQMPTVYTKHHKCVYCHTVFCIEIHAAHNKFFISTNVVRNAKIQNHNTTRPDVVVEQIENQLEKMGFKEEERIDYASVVF